MIQVGKCDHPPNGPGQPAGEPGPGARGPRRREETTTREGDGGLVETAVREFARAHPRELVMTLMGFFGGSKAHARDLCRRFYIDPETGKERRGGTRGNERPARNGAAGRPKEDRPHAKRS